jgi:uncharacterized protein (TIGR02118 family)
VITVFALIPKRPDIDDARFHAHWRDPHGVLALRITTLRRYVQHHRVDLPVPGPPPAIYRGIAEVLFDDLDTALGMGADPDYTEGAGADEPNFIDTDRLAFMFTEERSLLPGTPAGREDPEATAMILLRARDGVDPEGLAAAAGDLVANLPGLRRATLCTALPRSAADGGAPYDAVLALSWPDRASFAADRERGAVGEHLAALETVADVGSSAAMLTEPYRLIWP